MANSAKDHIEELRRDRFWIGGQKNPLSKSLRMAVKYLSAELYSKDVHFLMELIQNAEDNEYPEGVEPSLEFMVTSKDITATGAPATLLIFNNERGFSRKNMESICNVGDSTKAGNRKCGYIGEKGIGFKSVFLLTSQPYIFSNGYQIRFSETPCPDCDIAYIVPEWVDTKPSLLDIEKLYGHSRTLPSTTLILPLKPDKVKAVKDQLSSLHPELLLFLSKIKRLSVKEDNVDANLNTIRAISISSERDFVSKKSIDAESYTVHLTAEDVDDPEGECSYYMWRQRFPVKKENRVEKRMDLEECTITLAFPFAKRLNRGMASVGIYAFLPTEVVTNLPFIIQADFLLPSSRETILWDDVWNQGILDYLPAAFINAFVSLVKTREDAPTTTLANMFSFLPIKSSSHPKLNVIRESIRERLLQEYIIPSESHSAQKYFHKPQEVGRLMPSFWKILLKAKRQGAKLHNLSSIGKHILDSSFDTDEYNDVLNFLGIEFVKDEWYPKCIQICNLVLGVGEDVYVHLLCFVAGNWRSQREVVKHIPLLKYIDASGNVSLLSINEAQNRYTLCRSEHTKHISWLIDWSKEFRSAGDMVFLPEKTQELSSSVNLLLVWLKDHVKVQTLNVCEYASSLLNTSFGNKCQLVLAFARFIYLSFSKDFISKSKVKQLCRVMPLLNSYGSVTMIRKGVLVPANGSNWVDLMGSNPWIHEGFMELAEGYLDSWQYGGQFVPKNALISFLRSCSCASDIPDVFPPDAPFPTVSGPLTKENAFLLLDWIRKLRSKGVSIPSKFLSSVKNGSWLKVTMSGSPGYKPPSQSFLPSSSWGSLLQNGSQMVDIPLVDQSFYGITINQYEEELKLTGLMSDRGQACEFIAKHLMSLASYHNLTATKVVTMLKFIKFLRENFFPVDEFVDAIKNGRWVRTSFGERLPSESVLYDFSWKIASSISEIPFLDQVYYGNDILNYKVELDLLGVLVGFKQNYQIVIDHLKPSVSLSYIGAEPLLLALKCIRNSHSSGKLVRSLKEAKCLRTNNGYLNPGQCFLFDPEWGCILKVFDSFSFIDGDFYGNEIFEYKSELVKLGVVVEFDAAVNAFCDEFKGQTSSKSFANENVLSFLTCYKTLRSLQRPLPTQFIACARDTKWLRTRITDFRSPKECILYDRIWQPISRIAVLPFIDDSDKCYGNCIMDFKNELENFGVVVDFEKGAELVFEHIFFPSDPTNIRPDSVISLLDCIRNYNKQSQRSFPENFLERIHGTKWLKTTSGGYKSPKECLLFDPKRKSSLQRGDGPFIDEEYYGSAISSYKKELDAIGVLINVCGNNDASSLLAHHIYSQSDFDRIVRIYDFLRESDWRPSDGAQKSLWVQTSSIDGVWVSPKNCVLNDDNGLFSSMLHVLDKHYDQKLLTFFSKAFKVRRSPSTVDYCKLWIDWENTRCVVSPNECCAFWAHVIRHWNTAKKLILETVTKIPAVSPASDDIHLVNKRDVFLPDDLLLKDLFEKSSSHPFFIWFPRRSNSSLISRATLHGIYDEIGVRKISKSVSISELSTSKCGEMNPKKDAFIVKGLVMLILGFLADPLLNIEVKDRHETIKSLLSVSVFKTPEPITVSYDLILGSNTVIKVSTSQMVRWERESSELFTQKVDRSGGQRSLVEYATRFSEAVANGLLWEKEDQIHKLAELIKFGFLVDFDVDAVDYFMKSKNMMISLEDEEFLASAFPSC